MKQAAVSLAPEAIAEIDISSRGCEAYCQASASAYRGPVPDHLPDAISSVYDLAAEQRQLALRSLSVPVGDRVQVAVPDRDVRRPCRASIDPIAIVEEDLVRGPDRVRAQRRVLMSTDSAVPNGVRAERAVQRLRAPPTPRARIAPGTASRRNRIRPPT